MGHNLICQAEEIFDAASRYLLFPLKRVAADVLLPHLEMVSPAEMCHWLIISDMYVVSFFLVLFSEFLAVICEYNGVLDLTGSNIPFFLQGVNMVKAIFVARMDIHSLMPNY